MNLQKKEFADLKGKTLTRVEINHEGNEIKFQTDDNHIYLLWHDQDCCETVEIESVGGDVADLVGTPILLAEAAESPDNNPTREMPRKYMYDTATWTFYKLRTLKGSVDIRWYGVSNGCYSESVDFCEIVK